MSEEDYNLPVVYYIDENGYVSRNEYGPYGTWGLTGDISIASIEGMSEDLHENTRLILCHIPQHKSCKLLMNKYLLDALCPAFEVTCQKICPHCPYKLDVNMEILSELQSNPNTFKQRFDIRFEASKEEKSNSKCFLQFYTMATSYINNQHVMLAMFYHVRTDEDRVVLHASSTEFLKSEHTFAFVWGFHDYQMEEMLNFRQSPDPGVSTAQSKITFGITPEQLLARILQHQDEIVTEELIAIKRALALGHIEMVEERLIEGNRRLWEARSTIHRLNGVIDLLLNKLENFQASIENWLEAQNESDCERIRLGIKSLTICKTRLLVKEQLENIKQSIEQDRIEAQILQEHINLNISKVRSVKEEAAREVQLQIAKNTARDGFNMKVIAALTALFLPGTFMAILLTTPMFNWSDPHEPIIVKLPFKIYWGTTGGVTVLFIILGIGVMYPDLLPDLFRFVGDLIPRMRNFFPDLFRRTRDLAGGFVRGLIRCARAIRDKRGTTTEGEALHDLEAGTNAK